MKLQQYFLYVLLLIPALIAPSSCASTSTSKTPGNSLPITLSTMPSTAVETSFPLPSSTMPVEPVSSNISTPPITTQAVISAEPPPTTAEIPLTTILVPATSLMPTTAATSSMPSSTKPSTTIPRTTTTPTTTIAPPTFPAISVPPVTAGQTLTAQQQAALNGVSAQFRNSFANFLACLEESRSKNPGMEALYDAKITVLKDPELANKIINNKWYLVDSAPSVSGKTIAFVAVYPNPEMRADAWYALEVAKLSLPVLEEFMGTPFPSTVITLHYGFMMGSSGGGGGLILEDKTTYMGRWKPPMMPYDPVICHELSHAYIGHEGLNQFLEIYTFNRLLGKGSAFADWLFVRDYQTWTGKKTGYAAIVDVYQLIGFTAIQQAYRAIYALKPPYGQPLPENCKQVFVDQAPEAQKQQVRDLMAGITY